ncbi:MAG: DUF2723 domain-containing protein [Elusimicrobia bacterium]|nr:DUF2723 domain-containing protein [Elusimicrobiota bacterium]
MIITFLTTFAIFVYTAFPTVAVYRDAGEMASVSLTLGIAHPPGYPLYVILGKIFTIIIPFGNIAYRINLMSAFFGALTCLLVYLIIKQLSHLLSHSLIEAQRRSRFIGTLSLSGVVAAMALAFSSTFWSVSIVAEMYTLNTFFIALIIYLLLMSSFICHPLSVIRHLSLATFLFGLAMGNRIDIVLIAPGILVWLIFSEIRKQLSAARVVISGLLLLAGFSVFLYLPVRSKTKPVLNWNKPDNMETFINTITRKTHGKTLDLISSRYTVGDVIIPEMKVYIKRTVKLFTYMGLPFIILGIIHLYRKKKIFFAMTAVAYFLAGPFFIAIAKMPPNPHALAIMDPHYLISDMMLIIWFGSGILPAIEWLKKYSSSGEGNPQGLFCLAKQWGTFVLLIIPVLLFISNFSNYNMRYNFNAYDFARNVFRSVPGNSIVISREDVQVFSQWYLQFIENRREDIAVIAKGLSGSEWYAQTLKKYKDVTLVSLKQPDMFALFYNANTRQASNMPAGRQIFYTSDVEDNEMLSDRFSIYPYGITFNIKDKKITGYTPIDFEQLYIFRTPLNPDLYPDLFTEKIISQYAYSLQRTAMFFMQKHRYDEAEKYFNKALSVKKDIASIYFNLGWISFNKKDFVNTERYYKESIKFYKELHKQSLEYKSFPEVVQSIIKDWAIVHNDLAITYEKQKRYNEAISEYYEAIQLKPDYIDAHYNMAVTYWYQENWEQVIRKLEDTLRLNPRHQDARKYLYLAKRKIQN